MVEVRAGKSFSNVALLAIILVFIIFNGDLRVHVEPSRQR